MTNWDEEDLKAKMKENPDLNISKEGLRPSLKSLPPLLSRRGTGGPTEADFSSQIEDLLNLYQWHWAHIRPARVLRKGKEIYETPYSGHKGFLDYLCLRPPRIVVIELKSGGGEMTPEQMDWFQLWEDCQRTIIVQPFKIKKNKKDMGLKKETPILTLPEVYLWRPADFDRIVEILR